MNILSPGPGVGGHCIAVDPWFIVAGAPEQARLIRTAREVNDDKPSWVIGQVAEAIEAWTSAGHPKPRIACYGLAFKADIDDLRESPAIKIVTELARRGDCDVWVIEPNIEALPPSLEGIELITAESARCNADIHLLLVDHREFRFQEAPTGFVIDTRGVWR